MNRTRVRLSGKTRMKFSTRCSPTRNRRTYADVCKGGSQMAIGQYQNRLMTHGVLQLTLRPDHTQVCTNGQHSFMLPGTKFMLSTPWWIMPDEQSLRGESGSLP